MKTQKFLLFCLSLLLLGVAGCAAPNGIKAGSGSGSAENAPASVRMVSSTDSSGRTAEADASRYRLQYSGETPAGLKLTGYVFAGRDSGNSPDRIDKMFLSRDEGWKACWNDTGWYVDLYKTGDGGKTWETLQLKMKAKDAGGMTFLNRRQGYVFFGFTPAYGQITLNVTMDGGITWNSLNLTAPEEYRNCTFYTFPPAFFSDADGLIITHYWSEQKLSLKQLVFVTHDAGKSWKAADRTSDGNLSWDCVKLDGEVSHGKPSDTWRVTFEKKIWQSQNGTTWEAVK